MSILIAQPDILSAAAEELQSINAALRGGNAAAAAPTTGVVPAASDLVSLLTAAQFVNHAERYQNISAQAAAIQGQIATLLGQNAASYAATEAANVTTVS